MEAKVPAKQEQSKVDDSEFLLFNVRQESMLIEQTGPETIIDMLKTITEEINKKNQNPSDKDYPTEEGTR